MSRSDVSWWVLVSKASARSTPLATLLGVESPDSKIAPHTLYKVPLRHLPAPPAPQFFGFFAPF